MNEINLEKENNQSPEPLSNKGMLFLIIVVATVIIMLAMVIGLSGGTNSYLTYENYMEIHNGMTYNEVVEVLDNHQGELESSSGYGGYTLAYYSWSSSSGGALYHCRL